jgi:hypothetical protein
MKNLAKPTALAVASMLILAGCSESRPMAIPAESNPGEVVTDDSPLGASVPAIAEPNADGDVLFVLESSWQQSFYREQSKNSALVDAFAYFESRRDDSCTTGYTLHLEQRIPEEAAIREIVEETLAIFCDVLDDDVVIIVGNYHYAKEQISLNGYPSDDHGGVCGRASPGWSTGCANNNVTWQHIKFSGAPKMNQIVAHEIFHIVQDYSNEIDYTRIPPGDELYMPTWFVEGFAMFYEAALLEYLGLADYSDSYGYDPDLFVPSWFLEEIDLSERESDWSLGTYAVGHFAAEYLIANVGFEASLYVWEEMGKGESFDDAFAFATGLSVIEFYETTSRIRLQH